MGECFLHQVNKFQLSIKNEGKIIRHEILLNDGWRFHRGDIAVEAPAYKGPVYSQSKTERKKSGPAAYAYSDAPDQFASNSGILSLRRAEQLLPKKR
jgi:hypothetical protein